MRSLKGYLYASTASILWGTVFAVAKAAVESVDPLILTFYRFLFASVFLVLFLLMKGQINRLRMMVEHPKEILFLGSTGVAGMSALVFYGMKYTTAVNASIIMNSNPVLITLLSFLLLREEVTRSKISGVVIGFIGVCLVFWRGDPSSTLDLETIYGEALSLLSAGCWAAYTIGGKTMMQKRGPIPTTTAAMIVGSVILFLLISALNIDPSPNLSCLISAAYLGLIPTAVGFTAWFYALRELSASKVGVFQYLAPICTMILSALFLKEPVTLVSVVGFFLIVLGISISER